MIHTGSPRRIDSKTSVERVGEETLVYDEARHKAFCLNQTSSAIWRMCDGTRTPAQIAAAVTLELQESVTEELVVFALDQLRQDGLLQATPAPALPRLSRRELVEKLGVRALILLPAVAAVLVPEAAQALSGVVTGSRPSPTQYRLRQSLLDQQAASTPKQTSGSSDSSQP